MNILKEEKFNNGSDRINSKKIKSLFQKILRQVF